MCMTGSITKWKKKESKLDNRPIGGQVEDPGRMIFILELTDETRVPGTNVYSRQ